MNTTIKKMATKNQSMCDFIVIKKLMNKLKLSKSKYASNSGSLNNDNYPTFIDPNFELKKSQHIAPKCLHNHKLALSGRNNWISDSLIAIKTEKPIDYNDRYFYQEASRQQDRRNFNGNYQVEREYQVQTELLEDEEDDDNYSDFYDSKVSLNNNNNNNNNVEHNVSSSNNQNFYEELLDERASYNVLSSIRSNHSKLTNNSVIRDRRNKNKRPALSCDSFKRCLPTEQSCIRHQPRNSAKFDTITRLQFNRPIHLKNGSATRRLNSNKARRACKLVGVDPTGRYDNRHGRYNHSLAISSSSGSNNVDKCKCQGDDDDDEGYEFSSSQSAEKRLARVAFGRDSCKNCVECLKKSATILNRRRMKLKSIELSSKVAPSLSSSSSSSQETLLKTAGGERPRNSYVSKVLINHASRPLHSYEAQHQAALRVDTASANRAVNLGCLASELREKSKVQQSSIVARQHQLLQRHQQQAVVANKLPSGNRKLLFTRQVRNISLSDVPRRVDRFKQQMESFAACGTLNEQRQSLAEVKQSLMMEIKRGVRLNPVASRLNSKTNVESYTKKNSGNGDIENSKVWRPSETKQASANYNKAPRDLLRVLENRNRVMSQTDDSDSGGCSITASSSDEQNDDEVHKVSRGQSAAPSDLKNLSSSSSKLKADTCQTPYRAAATSSDDDRSSGCMTASSLSCNTSPKIVVRVANIEKHAKFGVTKLTLSPPMVSKISARLNKVQAV